MQQSISSVLTCILWLALSAAAAAQQPTVPEAEPDEPTPQVGQSVSVDQTVSDAAISRRLMRILTAAGWFEAPTVRVDQGVVFLVGRVSVEESKVWAGDLARNTEGVVAVVNRIAVAESSIWDLSPA